MAQNHRFIDGVSYTESNIADVFYQLQGINFVIPYGGLLEVTSSGTGNATVNVATGLAEVFGFLYENTATVSFVLDSQGGGNNRIDRIVLRRDLAANTVRLVVIKGVAAAAPTVPALTANDMALFYVWVANGFGAASTVANTDIHDERIFYQPAPMQDSNPIENLIANPEFMVWSAPATGTDEPEQWYCSIGGATTILAGAAIGTNTRRGRSVVLNCDNAGNYFMHYLTLSPDPNSPAASYFTVAGTVTITSGTPSLTFQRVGGPTILQRIFRRTGTYTFLLRGSVDFNTYPGVYRLIWSVDPAATAVFTLGEHVCTKGYVPGPFGMKKEIIKFDHEGTDAAWNASVKATGTYTVDTSATFGNSVLRSISAVMGRLIGSDDNSSILGAGCNVGAYNHEVGAGYGGFVDLRRDTNSAVREDQMIVGLSRDATPSFQIIVNAQGNFSVTLKLLGVST